MLLSFLVTMVYISFFLHFGDFGDIVSISQEVPQAQL